jgi:hypothetical protein
MTALTACAVPAPKPPQPAPLVIASGVPPAAVVQRAAQALITDGFEIATSDAAGGILVARKTTTLNQSAGFYVCRWGASAPGAASVQTELTISVIAKAAGQGSDASLTAHTRTAHINYGQNVRSADASVDDCATSGLAESHVAAAIR